MVRGMRPSICQSIGALGRIRRLRHAAVPATISTVIPTAIEAGTRTWTMASSATMRPNAASAERALRSRTIQTPGGDAGEEERQRGARGIGERHARRRWVKVRIEAEDVEACRVAYRIAETNGAVRMAAS